MSKRGVERSLSRLENVPLLTFRYTMTLTRVTYCKILLEFNCRKKFVPTYENTYFIWSENRNDVIQHISLVFFASWMKIRKNKT